MNTQDPNTQSTTKITKSVTPRHPDVQVIDFALRARLSKINGTPC
jgi:hypothetical protein